MKRSLMLTALLATTALAGAHYACAGQAPAAASDPDIPISHRDRVYSAEQYSNTLSVTDPGSNTLLGTIHLGDPLSPPRRVSSTRFRCRPPTVSSTPSPRLRPR
jgi:hypothetical protein